MIIYVLKQLNLQNIDINNNGFRHRHLRWSECLCNKRNSNKDRGRKLKIKSSRRRRVMNRKGTLPAITRRKMTLSIGKNDKLNHYKFNSYFKIKAKQATFIIRHFHFFKEMESLFEEHPDFILVQGG